MSAKMLFVGNDIVLTCVQELKAKTESVMNQLPSLLLSRLLQICGILI